MISLFIGLVISLIIMMVKKNSLKSVKIEQTACNYVRSGSFRLAQSNDNFLYSNVNRTQRQQRNTTPPSSPHSRADGGSLRTTGGIQPTKAPPLSPPRARQSARMQPPKSSRKSR